ncbi:MAG: hypothetical protein ACRDIA_08805, partial [Actinomycetota bacterium]
MKSDVEDASVVADEASAVPENRRRRLAAGPRGQRIAALAILGAVFIAGQFYLNGPYSGAR